MSKRKIVEEETVAVVNSDQKRIRTLELMFNGGTSLTNLIMNYSRFFTHHITPLLCDLDLRSLLTSNKLIYSKFLEYLRMRKYIFFCKKIASYHIANCPSSSAKGVKIQYNCESDIIPLFRKFLVMERDVMGRDVFDVSICQWFLEKISLFSSKDNAEKFNFIDTMIEYKCSPNFTNFFLSFLSQFSLIDSMDSFGRTSLCRFAEMDNFDERYLVPFLEAKANPFLKDLNGGNILHALAMRRTESDECLINCFNILCKLPGFNCDASLVNGETPFLIYIQHINVRIETLNFLVSHGSDPKKKIRDLNSNALHLYFGVERESNNLEVVKLLVDSKVDVDTRNFEFNTPLYNLCFGRNLTSQDFEIMKLLLAKGASTENIGRKGASILHAMTIKNGYRREHSEDGEVTCNFIRELIKNRGMQCDILDSKNETPLFSLCLYANFETESPKVILEQLLKMGASPNAQDRRGRTILHAFCENFDNSLGALEILLAAGASPTKTTNKGKTVLHMLCKKGFRYQTDVLKKIISSSATGACNMQTKKGNTPLHLISARSFLPMRFSDAINILLSAGADPNIKNKQGITAKDIWKNKNRNAKKGIFMKEFWAKIKWKI